MSLPKARTNLFNLLDDDDGSSSNSRSSSSSASGGRTPPVPAGPRQRDAPKVNRNRRAVNRYAPGPGGAGGKGARAGPGDILGLDFFESPAQPAAGTQAKPARGPVQSQEQQQKQLQQQRQQQQQQQQQQQTKEPKGQDLQQVTPTPTNQTATPKQTQETALPSPPLPVKVQQPSGEKKKSPVQPRPRVGGGHPDSGDESDFDTQSVLEPPPSVAWTDDMSFIEVVKKKKQQPIPQQPIPHQGPGMAQLRGNRPVQPALVNNLPRGAMAVSDARAQREVNPPDAQKEKKEKGKEGNVQFVFDERTRRVATEQRFYKVGELGDYEIVDKHQKRIDPRAMISLVADPDTKGRAMWRMGLQHTGILNLPRGFDPTDQANLPLGCPRMDFVQTALSTNTYIVPSVKRVHGGDRVILTLWGLSADVEYAINHIESWLAKIPEECRNEWVKTRSAATELLMRKLLKAPQKREKYRRPPKIAETFEETLVIKWHKRDWKLDERLGRSLEALDPIRMEQKVYILLEQSRDTGSTNINILGPKNGDVRKAIKRIYNIDNQVDAQEYDKPDIVLFKRLSRPRKLVYLASYSGPKCTVDIEAHEELVKAKIKSTFGLSGYVPLLGGDKLKKKQILKRQSCLTPLDDAGIEDDDDQTAVEPSQPAPYPEELLGVGQITVGALDVEERNLRLIEATTVCTLRFLQYFRGNLTMRVRLGAYYMDAVKNDGHGKPVKHYELTEYENLVNSINSFTNDSVKNYISKEIANRQLESKMLDRFLKSGAVLVPNKRATGSLKEVEPEYSGTFYIKDDIDIFQLVVTFDGDDNRKSVRWAKMFPTADGPTRMMHITLADLEGGPSVGFGIEGTLPVQEARLKANFIAFAKTVRLQKDKALDKDSTERFILFGPEYDNMNVLTETATTVKLVHFEQRRSWKFNMRASDWVVELFMFQNARFLHNSPLKAIGYEPRWGVQMWHEQWDQALGYNSTLGIGESSPWQPEEWQFFPHSGSFGRDATDQEWNMFQQGSGFRKLLEHADTLTQIVKGDWVKAEKSPTVG